MDYIRVYQDGNEKIADLLNAHGDEIRNEVMAKEIILGQMSGYSKEWNINGENVKLGVEKISG